AGRSHHDTRRPPGSPGGLLVSWRHRPWKRGDGPGTGFDARPHPDGPGPTTHRMSAKRTRSGSFGPDRTHSTRGSLLRRRIVLTRWDADVRETAAPSNRPRRLPTLTACHAASTTTGGSHR